MSARSPPTSSCCSSRPTTPSGSPRTPGAPSATRSPATEAESYSSTRISANNADIATTIVPVAITKRSASKRRIDNLLVSGLLDEAVAFGVVLRHRYLQLAERVLDRIHHHVRSADEVLVFR